MWRPARVTAWTPPRWPARRPGWSRSINRPVLWFACCGLAITGGYHRYFSHPTYKANAFLRAFYLMFGAASVQNSALKWSADHRVHHAKTDTNAHTNFSETVYKLDLDTGALAGTFEPIEPLNPQRGSQRIGFGCIPSREKDSDAELRKLLANFEPYSFGTATARDQRYTCRTIHL